LKAVPWIKPGTGDAWSYTSEYFVLISNAREEIVRRAAIRLEQIFTAYARFLPPRRSTGQPTTIVLVRSLAEYQALLKEQGRNLLNPAFYDSARNQVICATDLQRLGDQLEQRRKQLQQQTAMLKDREEELKKQYKNKVPQRFLNEIQEARQQIELINKKD